MPEIPKIDFTLDELHALYSACMFADSESKPYVVDNANFHTAYTKIDGVLQMFPEVNGHYIWKIHYRTEETDSAGDINYSLWATCKKEEEVADSFRSLVERMLPIDIQVKKVFVED